MPLKTAQETSPVNSTEWAGGNDAETSQYIKQERTPPDKIQKKDRPQKPRYRASIACVSCRDRRIRCVVTPGQNECTRCKNSGGECIIKDDDERRRPISRAYMCSLTDRVTLLENILKERGIDLPPTSHPPKSRHEGRDIRDTSSNRTTRELQTQGNDGSSPGSQSIMHEEHSDFNSSESRRISLSTADSVSFPPVLSRPKGENMVRKLLSTQGHFSFDQLNRPLRFFGPTTNCHIYSKTGGPHRPISQPSSTETHRANRIITNLSLETHDYLMDLFWFCYNPVIRVLSRDAFLEDQKRGGTQFYSPFLHTCILAMGYRFANKENAEIKKIALLDNGSTLHREARQLLGHELENPGGIPSIVALLLLGDLEGGIGRDDLGWMYAGMAVRLAFDIGLHLDTRLLKLSEFEIRIRRMTLRACIIYDRYWSLFLGRPTSIKVSDIEVSYHYKMPESLGIYQNAGPETSLDTEIYEAHFDLMELAGKVTEIPASDSTNEQHRCLQMSVLDRDFNNWYARLPQQLCWTPENAATAPYSFFLLHQQYHSNLILLHRPFAHYEDRSMRYADNSPEHHYSKSSAAVCTRSAIKVAQIFWQHRQRFDTKLIFITGVQHAGTAAIALVAAIASEEDINERQSNMEHLESLLAALEDMSATYQPAERISGALRTVVADLHGYGGSSFDESTLYKPRSSTVPARRRSLFESGNNATQRRPTSRRKASVTEKPSRLITQNFPRANPRPRGRSRGLSRNNSFHAVASTGGSPISLTPPEFSKVSYVQPPVAHNMVDMSSTFGMWNGSNMQMRTNFEPEYTTTPSQNMQFANMVHHPSVSTGLVNGGINLGQVPLENGGWDTGDGWYVRTTDTHPVDGFQQIMWEEGTQLNYSQGIGSSGI